VLFQDPSQKSPDRGVIVKDERPFSGGHELFRLLLRNRLEKNGEGKRYWGAESFGVLCQKWMKKSPMGRFRPIPDNVT